MSLTGDPDGPPTKSGLSLVDLSGGYVVGDRGAGRALARAPRRRRLRLRHLALRDRAARADVRRHLGGDRGLRAAAHGELGASVDRPVPELRDRRRLDRRRLRRSRSSGSAVRARSGGPSSPTTRASPTSPRRDRNRDELLAMLDAAFAERDDATSGSTLLDRRRRPVRAGQRRRGGARGPAGARPRGRRRVRAPARSARCARSRRRCGSATSAAGPPRRRSAASTPRRCCASSAATTRSDVRELAGRRRLRRHRAWLPSTPKPTDRDEGVMGQRRSAS